MKDTLISDNTNTSPEMGDGSRREGLTYEPDQRPQEENGGKRWSIYFKSKKLRSYSVKENSSNINEPRGRRLSDFIGLQNINVSSFREYFDF